MYTESLEKMHKNTHDLVKEIAQELNAVWDEHNKKFKIQIEDSEPEIEEYHEHQQQHLPLIITKYRLDGVKFCRLDVYFYENNIEITMEYRGLSLSFACFCIDYLPQTIASLLSVKS